MSRAEKLDRIAEEVVHIGNKLTGTDKYDFDSEELLLDLSVDAHTSHGKDKDVDYAERVMKRIRAIDNEREI